MIYRLLAIVIVTLAAVSVPGCKKDAEPPVPVEPAEMEVVEEDVTEENLDAELDKLEKEIEADIAAEE